MVVHDQDDPIMVIQTRRALQSDRQAISEVVFAAFGKEQGREISQLILDLYADESAKPLISLVATVDDEVVGHILFTTAHIKDSARKVSSAILAPLSVHPKHQGKGIGGRLVQAGLSDLQKAGVDLVFVLGHPSYYPKCGFKPAGKQRLFAPHPIPRKNADAWMVKELRPGVSAQITGQVVCAGALDDPRHWRE
ncbi:MAG: N-acetyltransferase [Synechococcaceae cyanobacterium]|nr:N-acetyltransferase [Synechococcaceae cyanobacterium]